MIKTFIVKVLITVTGVVLMTGSAAMALSPVDCLILNEDDKNNHYVLNFSKTWEKGNTTKNVFCNTGLETHFFYSADIIGVDEGFSRWSK